MNSRISILEISEVFQNALAHNEIICYEDSSLIFYALDFLEQRVRQVQKLFPPDTIHAIAVKANPLIRILEKFKGYHTGLETASLAELFIAEKLGFKAEKIVFDSPSKTQEEIDYALKLGVHINADSFNELARISKCYYESKSTSRIGLRINPQVGSGTIQSTSVAGKISKFGIPLKEHKHEIIQAFLNYKWLNGVHLHIGSQGISIDLLLDGLKSVFDLVVEINLLLQKEGRQIEYFDMGGGFPVSYHFNATPPSLENYVYLAKSNFPNLFSGKFKLITEYGRYINANSAWAASRVEYVKEETNYKILSVHLGADFLLRKAYNPNDWHHEISVLDKNGILKTDKDPKKYIIAGPLCFAGDIIAKDIELPMIEEGDYIIIHDVGAYTLSMWSRYNSRQIPKILAYSNKSQDFEILKNKESLMDVFNFWK